MVSKRQSGRENNRIISAISCFRPTKGVDGRGNLQVTFSAVDWGKGSTWCGKGDIWSTGFNPRANFINWSLWFLGMHRCSASNSAICREGRRWSLSILTIVDKEQFTLLASSCWVKSSPFLRRWIQDPNEYSSIMWIYYQFPAYEGRVPGFFLELLYYFLSDFLYSRVLPTELHFEV